MPEERPSTEVIEEAALTERISRSQGSGDVVSATLKTDQRVIARVTDGIYRQPGSALRELISNAYDADATRVVIKTDAPRFQSILIEDNGLGMSPAALAHLILHIGGSAKRSEIGDELGITSSSDPSRSPGGRRLIGKIGIGLFSVSQLTHTFQIVTKVKGDNYRTIATIALRQYSDEGVTKGEETEFESGKVNIWREKATDIDAQGTSITLTDIRPQARNTLRSREVWAAIEQEEAAGGEHSPLVIEPPRFHIGRFDDATQKLLATHGAHAALPWRDSDTPEEAFSALVDAVWGELRRGNPNPQLERVFDYYLRMVWQLSLAIPAPYVERHLFDEPLADWAIGFQLSNSPKGSASRLNTPPGVRLRDAMKLVDSDRYGASFDVFFDDLKLMRPIKFRGLPMTQHALKEPLVFVGKCDEAFVDVPRELSGGRLTFEAYLYWTPKVVPTEHQGSLVRIHGSSGTLFDSTFMRYQVSEQTRLRQITCEVFVSEGLDSALNIDRESFNNAHPHAVFITKWLHSSLRQLATAQKKLASEAREQSREREKGAALSAIQRIVEEIWLEQTQDSASSPPVVALTTADDKSSAEGAYSYVKRAIIPPPVGKRTAKLQKRDAILEQKITAIAQILASFGVFEMLTRSRQERLLNGIYRVLGHPES
jgi:hypothetical protein